MMNAKIFNYRLAVAMTGLLSIVGVICANSTTCFMVHEPEAPAALNRFSKIK